jgi:hypothetical protein
LRQLHLNIHLPRVAQNRQLHRLPDPVRRYRLPKCSLVNDRLAVRCNDHVALP